MKIELLSTKENLGVWQQRKNTRLLQQTNLQWLDKGEVMSHFFKSFAAGSKSLVKEMTLGDGLVLDSPEAIYNGAVEHFSSFLCAKAPRRLLDISLFVKIVVFSEENEKLMQLSSIQEVKNSLFSIPIDSSPSLDGFRSDFYQSYWDIVEEDVVEAVREFFCASPMPQFYLASCIVFIPNVSKLSGFDKFRPISL